MISLRSYFSIGLLFLVGLSQTNAQIRFGIRVGGSTYDLGVSDPLNITQQSGKEYLLDVQDAKYGYHAGLVLQIKLASFVIQPELLFNSNSVDYTFQEVSNPSARIFTEKYQNLDIPILLGLKAGPMRLMAGPVGHYFLKSTSDLFEFESYKQKFNDLTYGWQGGIGVDLLNVMIDVRYEGNFSKFGDHITFSGQRYSFASKPARLIASLAITIK